MIVTRFREDQDLKQNIEKLVAAMNISAAAVISGARSLKSASLRPASARGKLKSSERWTGRSRLFL
jgi:predicted DNA-binding protein with PD1-like motif